ncbi:uncharacterized, partial [Tachysurus ichikawai]
GEVLPELKEWEGNCTQDSRTQTHRCGVKNEQLLLILRNNRKTGKVEASGSQQLGRLGNGRTPKADCKQHKRL